MRLHWFLLCALAMAGDWPQFRGPNGGGVAEDKAVYPAEFRTVWKAAIPEGLSSPVLMGSRIFVTGLEADHFAVIALDRATGRQLWKRTVPKPRAEKLHKLNHAASPSVATDGKSVVAFLPDFGLATYSVTGEERWRAPLGPFNNAYGMGVSPVIAEGRVILVVDQSQGSYAAAFDLANGEQLWRTPRKEALSGHSTPIVHGKWVLAPGSLRMDAYEIATGRVAWSVDGLPAEMKSVPVVSGDMVFVHGFNTPENDAGKLLKISPFAEALRGFDKDGDGKLSKAESPSAHVTSGFIYLDLDSNGVLDEAEWEQYIRTMRAENALLAYKIGGGLVWRFGRSIPQLPSPLVYRGVLYMINEGGVVTTLDAATGKLHKQARLRGEADRYYASPVAADGKVFIASHTGTVSVLKAGAEQELLAVNQVDEEVLATPALADGRVYLRTKGAVYCYGGK
ncbi:MAG: PQQ-binding-like beta-propeller repeat protein [Acidobacteria bacterium]|nr:PQQ-binding-like beta-propeller repeat protein [Acidobacteriota bacterium]